MLLPHYLYFGAKHIHLSSQTLIVLLSATFIMTRQIQRESKNIVGGRNDWGGSESELHKLLKRGKKLLGQIVKGILEKYASKLCIIQVRSRYGQM